MKKRKFVIGAIATVAFLTLTMPVGLAIINRSSHSVQDVYANYAVYRANGGKFSFLEWKENGSPLGQIGEKGEPGAYPIKAGVNEEGHLILVLSDGQEIDAGKMPFDSHDDKDK